MLFCKVIEFTNPPGMTTPLLLELEGIVILRWKSDISTPPDIPNPLPPKELEKLPVFNCKGGEDEDETEEWRPEEKLEVEFGGLLINEEVDVPPPNAVTIKDSELLTIQENHKNKLNPEGKTLITN